MKLFYRAQSHVGLVRRSNEDAYVVGGGQSDEYPGSLFVVCDGAGGQGAGEAAARFTANTIIETYYASDNSDRGTALLEAFQQVNRQVYQQHQGVGATTAVAALVVDGEILIVNAGDSRAYRIREGHLRQISEDHTYAEKLVREGIATREQLRTGVVHIHNVVYDQIGIPEKYFKADLFRELTKEEDAILLCTDGVWGFLEDAEIEQTIHEQPLENVVDRLIDLANARGGRDNVTAILIWREEQTKGRGMKDE